MINCHLILSSHKYTEPVVSNVNFLNRTSTKFFFFFGSIPGGRQINFIKNPESRGFLQNVTGIKSDYKPMMESMKIIQALILD